MRGLGLLWQCGGRGFAAPDHTPHTTQKGPVICRRGQGGGAYRAECLHVLAQPSHSAHIGSHPLAHDAQPQPQPPSLKA